MFFNKKKLGEVDLNGYSFNTFLHNILFNNLLPGGFVILILGKLFENNFAFYQLISIDFFYRLLISMLFLTLLGFIISWLSMNFYREISKEIDNFKRYKYRYIFIENVLGFGLPVGIIKYIIELESYSFSLNVFIRSVIIGLLIGVIYGVWDWNKFKRQFSK
jgi:hypothetical protein